MNNGLHGKQATKLLSFKVHVFKALGKNSSKFCVEETLANLGNDTKIVMSRFARRTCEERTKFK